MFLIVALQLVGINAIQSSRVHLLSQAMVGVGAVVVTAVITPFYTVFPPAICRF